MFINEKCVSTNGIGITLPSITFFNGFLQRQIKLLWFQWQISHPVSRITNCIFWGFHIFTIASQTSYSEWLESHSCDATPAGWLRLPPWPFGGLRRQPWCPRPTLRRLWMGVGRSAYDARGEIWRVSFESGSFQFLQAFGKFLTTICRLRGFH